jgi:hypothetical protein
MSGADATSHDVALRALSAVAMGILVSVATGCATSVSTARPAHVAEVGHFSGEAGVDLSASVGAIDKVLAAAESITQAMKNQALTSDEELTVLQGGAHLGFNPPSLIPHVGVYYVPLRAIEVGARLSGSGLRFGLRWQVLRQADQGIDLTVGAGLARSLWVPQIDSDSCTGTCVHMDSFERWDADASAVIGRHANWYRWWAGPRFLFSTVSEALTLTTPSFINEPGVPPTLSVTGAVSGQGFYAGACAGVALGYRSFFVGPELTILQLLGSANVSALGTTTNATLNNLVLVPAFAVMGEF